MLINALLHKGFYFLFKEDFKLEQNRFRFYFIGWSDRDGILRTSAALYIGKNVTDFSSHQRC